MEFATTLMDHVANDTKVTIDVVESHFHEWRAHEDEAAGIDAFMLDEYVNKYDLPRANRARMYDEYCAEKLRLYQLWKHAPAGNKTRALHDWVKLSVPSEIKDGVDSERIYTKNVMKYM